MKSESSCRQTTQKSFFSIIIFWFRLNRHSSYLILGYAYSHAVVAAVTAASAAAAVAVAAAAVVAVAAVTAVATVIAVVAAVAVADVDVVAGGGGDRRRRKTGWMLVVMVIQRRQTICWRLAAKSRGHKQHKSQKVTAVSPFGHANKTTL